MGLFNKKEKKESTKISDIPELPELPKLPDFPGKGFDESKEISQLPRFPNNALGNKFSQDTIKDAITGKKESEPEEIVNEFESTENTQMIQPPLKEIRIRDLPITNIIPKQQNISKEQEPLFVRLDKFEDSHKVLNDMRKQIKEIKQKEDEELKEWSSQLQNIKNKIERVEQDLFSKI